MITSYVRKRLGLAEKPSVRSPDFLSKLDCWKSLDSRNNAESTENINNNEKNNTFCPLHHFPSVSKESLACPSPVVNIEKEVSLSPLFGITSFTPPVHSPDLFDLDSIFDTDDESNWAADLSKWNNNTEDIQYV